MRKKQKLIFIAGAMLISLSLTACEVPFKEDAKSTISTNASNIVYTDLTNGISADRIYDTIKLLSATDDARITGFTGEKDTADYISKQFKNMGLTVTESSFPVAAYKCTSTDLNIIDSKNQNKKITSKVLSYSKATSKDGITAEIVFAGMGSEYEMDSAMVKDKIVLLQRGGEFFSIKAQRAVEKGAVGVVFYDPNQEPPVVATLGELSGIPAVSISKANAEELQRTLKPGNPIKVNLKVDSVCTNSESKNIVATLKSEKQNNGKCIILGAHYDGVDTPAANDNASGIATVLEAARALSKQKPDCDIKFIAFGAEEIGLVGSSNYVSSLSSDERNKIIGMLNFDMVGVGDTLEVHTMRNIKDSALVKLAEKDIKRFKYKFMLSEKESSDHVPFESAGIPVAYFEYGPDKNYHTDRDTIEKIQKEDLFNACNVAINMCNEIGENPEAFSN